MKRLVFTILLYLNIFLTAYSQDIVKLEHRYYTSWFSKSKHIPVVVTFVLKKNMIICANDEVERTNDYRPDPKLSDYTDLEKDYSHSGYDRGHNMSAEDNSCRITGMKECFYYSNMTPQLHSFNAGKWKSLENYERATSRALNKVIVTIGSEGVSKKIGSDSVVVPRFMWKVIYTPSTDLYECYKFPNDAIVNKPLIEYKVILSEIKESSNVDFINGVVSVIE